MDIGHRMKELRIQYGLTQQELADRAELTKGFISQLERNQNSPSIGTLLDIIQCLGTTPAEFFTDEEPEQIHADTLIENRAGKFNLSIFFECFLLFFVQQFLYEFLHGKRHVPFLCHIHKPSIYPEQQLLFRHIMDIGSSFFSRLF